MSKWAHKYIGKPWQNGGRGPDCFDCWGLLCWVYKEEFGIILPAFAGVDAKDFGLVGRTMNREAAGASWRRLEEPEDGCAVALGKRSLIHHVGIFIGEGEDLILHVTEHGRSVAQKPLTLRSLGYGLINYYKWQL